VTNNPERPILRGERRQELASTLAAEFEQGTTSIFQLAAEHDRRPSTVRRLLNEAGVRVHDGPFVGTPEPQLVAELARRYQRGTSIAGLVRLTGIDRRAIRRLLETAGISLPERPSRPENLRESLVRDYQAGASIRTLADEYGCSYGIARRLLLDAGIALRPRALTETAGDDRSQPAGLPPLLVPEPSFSSPPAARRIVAVSEPPPG
jgi:transposase-like protein